MGGRNRAVAITDAGLRAIGVQPHRLVPLIVVPWRDDRKDRRTRKGRR